MGANSNIAWTDHTFNPWIGCTPVGPGCDDCYARRRFDYRLHVATWGAGRNRHLTSRANWDAPRLWNAKADAFHAEHGHFPRVFCASLADVFDNEVPDDWRRNLFEVIRSTPKLRWILLTKRIGNAAKMLPDGWPNGFEHVGLMATVCNQPEADRDVHKLIEIPATWHGLSVEPMIGLVDLVNLPSNFNGEKRPLLRFDALRGRHHCGNGYYLEKARIDWVICGGESGSRARPLHPQWARSLRDQCAGAGVPFFFKQWGEWIAFYDRMYDPDWRNLPKVDGQFGRNATRWHNLAGGCGFHGEHVIAVRNVGVDVAGRVLDGRTHDEFPEALT